MGNTNRKKINAERYKWEKVIAAPVLGIERVAVRIKSLGRRILRKPPVRKAEEYWHILGPGLTTGSADDDPSGIATYSQAGAQFGSKFLWLAPLTFPIMATVQEMCARIGMVTGRGLAANIRLHYPRTLLFLASGLLFIANTFNIGADLGAMAKATQLLAPGIPFAVLVIGFTLLSLLLQIFVSYRVYSKYLKYLALVLLAYVLSGISVHPDWGELLKSSLWPTFSLNREQIFLVCAILGTTISPYLFFWQTDQEVEEEILEGRTNLQERKSATVREVKRMRIDVWSGMFLSNLAMWFIIATCSAVLFKSGITNITTAAEAAAALQPIAGDYAYLLFAVGIIGVGLLGVPVLAGSTSYAISESFGWRLGLYRKLKQAASFYGVIILSTVIGLGLNFIGLDPIKALIYAAVANGVVAPLMLAIVVLLSGNRKIMGDRVNRPATTVFGWLITVFMSLVGLAAIIAFF